MAITNIDCEKIEYIEDDLKFLELLAIGIDKAVRDEHGIILIHDDLAKQMTAKIRSIISK